jgi:hypothetical protein
MVRAADAATAAAAAAALAPAFPKASVYHSQLVGRGPLCIRLTAGVIPSKFKDKPAFAPFQVRGDTAEYRLTVENDTIRERLASLPLNTWVEVQAAGSRDAATLEVLRMAPQRTPTARRMDAGAAGPGESPAGAAAPAPSSLENEYWTALEAAVRIVGDFQRQFGREPSEAERAIACTLWIQANRERDGRPLAAPRPAPRGGR